MQVPYSNVSTNYSPKPGALRASLAALFLTFIVSCVTTTTGGFDPASSEEQAVIDYSRLALAYFEAGELVSARRNANNALAFDDGAAASLEVLALISQREQDYSLAEDYFRLALRKAPTASRIRNNFAAFLFEQARYSEAYAELQSVVADTGYAGRAEAYENFGLTSLELKNTAEASEAFLRATYLEPSLVQSSLELCILSIERGEWPEARTWFERYLNARSDAGSDDTVAHSDRALQAGHDLASESGDEEAAATWQRLLDSRNATRNLN